MMSSSSCVLSSISWKEHAAAGSQTRPVSSFNLYGRHSIHFNSSFGSSNRPNKSPPPPPPLINNNTNNMPMRMSRGVHTMSGRIPSPWLMLPVNKEDKKMIYNFYKLAEKELVSFKGEENSLDLNYKMYVSRQRGKWYITNYEADLVGSSHGWLALFQRHKEKLFLSDPVSHRSIKLPLVGTLPGFDEYHHDDYRGCQVKNVVVSCSPDKEECRAMMIFSSQNRLAFCCPVRGREWTPIENPRRSYESVVYSSRQKLFFSVTKSLEFEAWDLSDPMSPRRISMDDVKLDKGKSLLACQLAFRNKYKVKAEDILDRQFLVIAEHSDELFLVRRFVMCRMGTNGLTAEENNDVPYKTIGFDVHRYDPVTRAFKYIDTGKGVHEYDPKNKAIKYTGGGGGGGSSLDSLALFVGLNHGFALRADEYPELRPNSIYFTDTEYVAPDLDPDVKGDFLQWHARQRYGGHDLGIFNYEDGTFSPCYYPCDYGSIKKIRPAPTWFTPSPAL